MVWVTLIQLQAAAKHQRLSNELTKAKSHIAEYERKLLAAKEHYCTLVNEEQAMSLLLLLSAAREGVTYFILDGRDVCIPRTNIIYLSDTIDVILSSFHHHLLAIIAKNTMGNMSSYFPPV
jgi:hypothetical protein